MAGPYLTCRIRSAIHALQLLTPARIREKIREDPRRASGWTAKISPLCLPHLHSRKNMQVPQVRIPDTVIDGIGMPFQILLLGRGHLLPL